MTTVLTRKAINFDLSVKQLKMNYSSTNPNKAYTEIRRELEKVGFMHRQGSGYVSTTPVTNNTVRRTLKNLGKTLVWLGDCVKKLDVTEVGETYDCTPFVQKSKPRNTLKQ
jgi:virulence-associated protein VapD